MSRTKKLLDTMCQPLEDVRSQLSGVRATPKVVALGTSIAQVLALADSMTAEELDVIDATPREMTLSERWTSTAMAEQELREQWKFGEYTGASCPNCSRVRLCRCPNGKTRCEKCNWVPEDGGYCEVTD